MTERLDEIERLIESNAKAIQALTDTVIRNEQRDERNRARLYEAMSRMAAAQSHFWQIQEDYYQRLDEIDRRQS